MTAIRQIRAVGDDGLLVRYAPGESVVTDTRASVATYVDATTYGGALSELVLRYAPGASLATAVATRASVATFSGAG